MRYKIFYLACICISMIATHGCASRTTLLVLDNLKEDTTIYLKTNQSYLVEVKENPSTGYSWQVDIENNSIELLKEDFKSLTTANDKKVGAGGSKNYEFRANQKGSCEVIFTHGRAWEDTGKTIKTIKFVIE